MHSQRNKEKLPQDASPGLESQPVLPDDLEDSEDSEDSEDTEEIDVDLEDIRKDVECPICLGIIRNTRVVMECLHRFCKDCIERSFRLGNNECPTCRTHCSSRRSLRVDTNFDTMIAIMFHDDNNKDDEEEEELCISKEVKNNTKSVVLEKKPAGVALEKKPAGVALEKKPAGVALEKKPAGVALEKKPAGVAVEKKPVGEASTNKSKVNLLRSSNRATRRSPRIRTSGFAGSSSNRERALAPISEEKETEVTPDTNKSESETDVNNAAKTVDGTKEGDAPQVEAVKDIISFADKLFWGKCRHRSYNRNNSRNVANLRNNRLARFVEHLQNLDQNDDELEIFIKLVSIEENRVSNLARPYLSCRPTLSIKQLCQYIAHETSLQTEEIELYLVKECQPDIISGDGKLDQDNTKFQYLAEEEETMAELKTNNLNFGHLVIAYKRKMWNLNEELSLG